jgi:transposase
VKGHKRHLLVDTLGLILHVLVHEAGIQDHEGGKPLLKPLKGCFPRLQLIWADSAYKKGGFIAWVKETFGWEVEVVEHRLLRPAWRLDTKGRRHRLGEGPPQWLPCVEMAVDC